MKTEIWKTIDGQPDYEVSNWGNVRSWKYKNSPKNLALFKINGYSKVNFVVDGKCKQQLVHRLVGQAFIENPQNKPMINHINGIKSDNRVENLEWVTCKENLIKHHTLNHDERICGCCIKYKLHIANLKQYGLITNLK